MHLKIASREGFSRARLAVVLIIFLIFFCFKGRLKAVIEPRSFCLQNALSSEKGVKFKFYPVKARSLYEAAYVIRLSGVRDEQNIPRDGYTRWYIYWDWDTKEGAVDPGSIKVFFKAIIYLPKWRLPLDLPYRQRREWDRYYCALIKHELNHLHIAKDNYKLIEEKLIDRARKSRIGERELSLLARKLVKELHLKDWLYDKRTRHGRTEGVYINLDL